MVSSQLRAAISRALGADVLAARSVGGGDFAQSFQITLDDHRTVFAKTHADPPPGFFVTEANGLSWLRESGTVAVPQVLAVGDASDGDPALLVMEWVEESTRIPADDSVFGRSLAALHRSGAPAFGREDRRPTGSRSLPNLPTAMWPEFYADRRLLPLVRMAADARAVDASVLRDIERIAAQLGVFGAADEPPARLHGDLWAGNRIVDIDGRSWLVDPAAHGGHREFDLAMMRLFGGFGASAFAAYDEVFPLAAGWQGRVPLHQLAPLLAHAIKFGGSYPAAVARAVASLTSQSS